MGGGGGGGGGGKREQGGSVVVRFHTYPFSLLTPSRASSLGTGKPIHACTCDSSCFNLRHCPHFQPPDAAMAWLGSDQSSTITKCTFLYIQRTHHCHHVGTPQVCWVYLQQKKSWNIRACIKIQYNIKHIHVTHIYTPA